MANVCQITGKKPMRGHNVSHANNKTLKIQDINLQYKRYFISELSRWVCLRVSAAGIKTLTKLGGLEAFLRRTPAEELNPVLRPVKKSLMKKS